MRTTPFLAAIAVAVVILFNPVAPTAHAGTHDIDCTGDETVTYKPGLKPTPHTVDVEVRTNYTTCLSFSAPSITSGVGKVDFTDELSCTDLDPPGPVTTVTQRTITWNTTETSLLQSQSATVVRGLASTVRTTVGTVISGRFAGGSYTAIVALANVDLDACLLSPHGLKKVSGHNVLMITGAS